MAIDSANPADDITNLIGNMKFVLRRAKNLVGNGKNAGYHTGIFSYSNNVFRKLLSQGCLNLGLCDIKSSKRKGLSPAFFSLSTLFFF